MEDKGENDVVSGILSMQLTRNQAGQYFICCMQECKFKWNVYDLKSP